MRTTDVRTPVAAAAATLLGALALSPALSSGTWRRPVVDAVLVVLLSGLALRYAGAVIGTRVFRSRPVPPALAALGTALVPLGQLAALTGYLTARFTRAGTVAGVVPTPAGIEALATALGKGADEVREQVAPALPVLGLMALLAMVVGIVAVLVDLAVVAGRQAVVAALPLLVLAGVPVFTLSGDVGLLPVIAPAAGLALLLWADQRRRLDADRASSGARGTGGAGGARGAGGATAVRIGLVAVLVGVLGGGVLPILAEGSLSAGPGGPGSTGVALDPVASLHGQLTRKKPIDLLRVETPVEEPGYLRAVTVDRYDVDVGWTLGNPGAQLPLNAQLPAVHPRESGRPVTATVEAVGHDDRFLPVPVTPLSVQLDGGENGWRFDPLTGTVVGADVTSEDRVYAVTASEVRPTPEQLAQTPPLRPGDLQERFTALPELDPRVTDQVGLLVDGVDGGYARVRKILDFLTDRANGFVYALATPPGTSGDDLVDFLTERRGYCEQYAGAMAVMVRAAGMPARLALGYTPGTVQDDGSRLVTSDDAHAWVEVYFSGLGWVPFDPTPIEVDRRAELPWAPRMTVEERSGEDAGLPAPPQDLALLEPVSPLEPDVDLTDPDVPAAAPAARSWPAGAGLVLLVAAAAAALPAGLRLLQRHRRVAVGTARALWDELMATADDLGVTRNPAWTPREAGRALAERTRETGGAEAIGRLARAEELASYGPATHTQDTGLGASLHTARGELLGSVDRGARLRATFWPASLPVALWAGMPAWTRRSPRTRGSRRPDGRRLGAGGAESYWS